MPTTKGASGGVYLAAYDTTASPVAGKAGDANNITGAWSKDGGAETSGFTTAHPTEIGGGIYWQPLTGTETNGDRLAFRWASSTSGIVIDPIFVDTITAPLTAAQIATGVWQDATAGDFTASGSIGKSLFTSGAVPGAAGGHFIAGTNAATVITTSLTTHLIGTVDTVTTLTNLPAITANWLTATGIASSALNGKGDWLTSLGTHPPDDWINAASIAPDADTDYDRIASTVWDEATTGHTTTGSFGAAVTSAGGLTLASVAAAVWDEVNTGATHNVNSSTGKQLRSIAGLSTAIWTANPIPDQTGRTSVQVKLDSGASSVDNAYRGDGIWALSGTGAGGGICVSYVGSTRIATIDTPWAAQPVAGDVVEVVPTGFARVAGYLSGQDPATLVWAAGSRTLTDLPVMPTDWVTAIGVSAAAVTKIQAGLSTYGGGDTPGTNTLLSRLSNTRAGLLDNLSRLDATVSSRSTYAGDDTAGVTTLLARLTDTRATRLDNLTNLDAAVSTRATNVGAADALLGRTITGGADGGRTVASAMAFIRNRKVIAGGTLTVYETNDSTPAWTGTVTTSASNPITGIDPA